MCTGNSYPRILSYSQNLEVEVANGEILGAEGCCPGFIDLIFRGSERCEEHMFCSWEMSGSSKSLVGSITSGRGSSDFLRKCLCGLHVLEHLPNGEMQDRSRCEPTDWLMTLL